VALGDRNIQSEVHEENNIGFCFFPLALTAQEERTEKEYKASIAWGKLIIFPAKKDPWRNSENKKRKDEIFYGGY